MLSFKKLLGMISVIVVATFVLMLTTSYAWYAFENGSTTFDVATNNDNIIVSYQRGEYISTNVAVPLASADVEQYSEKNNFTVRVKDNPIGNELLLTISLVDIDIDGSLQNSNFKIDLYHQENSVASIAGNTIGTGNATTKVLGTVTLDDVIDNNFEIRVYILDNGGDQSSMMNKSFQARIKLEVVSRLKTTMNDYANPDIYVSSITIDGQSSDHLPISGYYVLDSYDCDKDSSLLWEPLSKTLTYDSGSKVGDTCSLTFSSSTEYPLLSAMPVGSYVKYTGTNGCDGKHCEGYNANYVSDKDMGHCYAYKFITNGWRVAYVKDGSAYLISAGSPECTSSYKDFKQEEVETITLSSSYYYGSGYNFNKVTGEFSLKGVTSSTLNWGSNYSDIIKNTPYTCLSNSSTGKCTVLYEVSEYSSNSTGIAYVYSNYEKDDFSYHFANINSKALKYCNEKYAYNGVCDSSTTWNVNDVDVEAIIGNPLTLDSCFLVSSDKSCGYNNDLIDNGSYYWVDAPIMYRHYEETTGEWMVRIPYWTGMYRQFYPEETFYDFGVRPVVKLNSSVLVVGGSGTYEDPYQITISE